MKKITFVLIAATFVATVALADIQGEKMYPYGYTSDETLAADGYTPCTMASDTQMWVEGPRRNGTRYQKLVPAGTEMVCSAKTGAYTHIRKCSNRVEAVPDGIAPTADTDCCSESAGGNRANARGHGVAIGGSVNQHVYVGGDNNDVNVNLNIATPPATTASARQSGPESESDGTKKAWWPTALAVLVAVGLVALLVWLLVRLIRSGESAVPAPSEPETAGHLEWDTPINPPSPAPDTEPESSAE